MTLPVEQRSVERVVAVAVPNDQIIDLSCDVIVFERERDSTRVDLKRGDVWLDSGKATQGSLVVRPSSYRAAEQVVAPFRLRVVRPGGHVSIAGVFTTTPILLSDSVGQARLELSCPFCTEPKLISVEFPRGRTDTLDVFLTKLRNTCEIDAAKQAREKPSAPPPNDGW